LPGRRLLKPDSQILEFALGEPRFLDARCGVTSQPKYQWLAVEEVAGLLLGPQSLVRPPQFPPDLPNWNGRLALDDEPCCLAHDKRLSLGKGSGRRLCAATANLLSTSEICSTALRPPSWRSR